MELSQMYSWCSHLFTFSPFHLFTFSPLKALGIFSPFHLFTFSPLKGVSHLFTFSPFHFFTFSLFHLLYSLPIPTKTSSYPSRLHSPLVSHLPQLRGDKE